MEEVTIITKYISAWAWHLSAIAFLCVSAIVMVIGNVPMAIGFAIAMGICEYVALKRKKELDNGN